MDGYRWEGTFIENLDGSSTTGRYAVDKCLQFLHENGDTDNRIIVKTDNENAIQYVVKEVVEARQKDKTEVRPRTLVENSVEKDSKSNGLVEAAVQDVEGVIRGILFNMEAKMGVDIDSRERIIAFIPEYAAYLMNRLRKGEDGKIAYERLK